MIEKKQRFKFKMLKLNAQAKKPQNYFFAFLALWLVLSFVLKPKTVNFDYLKSRVEEGAKLEISLYEYGSSRKEFFVKINSERAMLPVYHDSIKEQETNFKSIGYTLPKEEMSFFEQLKINFFVPTLLWGAILFGAWALYKFMVSKKIQNRIAVAPELIKVKFDDVKGIDNVREEMQELLKHFLDSGKIKSMGGKPLKGALLHGPPGTGKTLIAKAIAGEAGANFYAMAGSEFTEMYVGVGPRRVRDLFDLARANKPSVIFIDEIDAMASKRGVDNNSERDNTVNEFLTQLDGVKHDNTDVLVIGATNLLGKLDAAVVRAGRFDRKVKVDLPTEKGRREILEYYLNKVKMIEGSVDILGLAKATSGFSGADIENLVNQSVYLAVKEGCENISEEHLYESKDKVQLGLKKDIIQSNENKLKTAFHEVGHAYVGYIKKMGIVSQVSIEPRERSLGVTQMVANEEVYSTSQEDLDNRLMMLLAGRVAEKVFCGEKANTGASDDLKRASHIARVMVTELGMGNMGPVNFSEQYNHLSDETKAGLDREVMHLLKQKEQEVELLLKSDSAKITKISNILLEKLTLNESEFSNLMSEKES